MARVRGFRPADLHHALVQDSRSFASRDSGSAVPSETLTASELWVAQRGRPVLTVIDGDGELVSPMHRASLRVV